MAEYIENQPVYLGATNTCSNDGEFVYNQLVDITDTTQFQLRVEPCISAEQIIVNPNFETDSDWTMGDNVGIADNQLCFSGETIAGQSGSYANSTSVFEQNKYYKISITVDSIVGTLDVYLESELLGSISSVGTHDFYGFANTLLSTGYMIICPQTDGATACISNVTSFEILTNFIIPIYDASGNYVTKLSYDGNPTLFTFAKDTVTVSVDWSEFGITSGCYYFCVLDPCENTNGQNYPSVITNTDFTGSATGWQLGLSWSYSSNTVIGTYGMSNALSQTNVFSSYSNSYSITVEITAGTGIDLDVYFGETLVDTLTSIGTHTVSGIPYGNGSLSFVIKGGSNITITSVIPVEIAEQDYVCNMTSNIFKIDDYSNECTLLVNACNNEDGMGFVFEGSGFSPQVRLNAKLKEPKYSNERLTYTDSLGKKINYYFKGRKGKYLCVDLEPEYILDFLWTLFGYDNVYIDGIAYTVDDDEFSPTYVLDNVGSVRFLVSKKQQDVKNVSCSSQENNCVIGENYLLQADDNSVFVTQTNGDYILIN